MKVIDIAQGTLQWHKLKQGIVSGTSLSSAIGTAVKQKTLLNKLVAERMTEVVIDDLKSPSVVRGVEMEPKARAEASRIIGIDFQEVGMLFHDDIENFGISPDGVSKTDGKIVGGIEIKCPDSKKHVEYIIQDAIPKEYWHQVYSPFLISEDINFWYFVSYDDRNYERPIFIKKLERSELNNIDQDLKKLKSFLNDVDIAHTNLSFGAA